MVSPTLLRPLTTACLTGTVLTPGKSILKLQTSPRASLPVAKIHFSPFNGTKVIPNRKGVGRDQHHHGWECEQADSDCSQDMPDAQDNQEEEQQQEQSSESSEDEDEEDWDENYVDSIARMNAERNTQLAER